MRKCVYIARFNKPNSSLIFVPQRENAMTEADLSQISSSWAALAYTSSQWWLTITTALVVATYLAAKHIPRWLMALIALLYILTAISVIFEVSNYGQISYDYGMRMM